MNNTTNIASEIQDAYHLTGGLSGDVDTFEVRSWASAREYVARIRAFGFGASSTGRGWEGLRAWARSTLKEIDTFATSIGVDAFRGEMAIDVIAEDPAILTYDPTYAARHGVNVVAVRATLAERIEKVANAPRRDWLDGVASRRARDSWMEELVRAWATLERYEGEYLAAREADRWA